ncbi:hypothetical protein [Noviluteimonas gilva]|uniref:Uncharacterized protein n=1 Tax=Noviluteimonas gilva TaxID=2682097 RepID=A0A7C9I498_9GAMM|nr:hypothetical protein [Lysobacter gilvus]MUV13549.1 hypothetical protein [Lysobacter gilvus]
MNAQLKTEFDLSDFVIALPKWLTQPIERATDDEAGRLAMLDAMDETRGLPQ